MSSAPWEVLEDVGAAGATICTEGVCCVTAVCSSLLKVPVVDTAAVDSSAVSTVVLTS